jgi:putative tricarboxylic transport membrane protein
VMLLILNLPLIGVWVKILKIPYHFLFSIILLLCVVGSYITNNNPYDVVIMGIFGLIGYLMKKFDYEAAPLVLALVLGPMMERAFQRSLIISGGNLGMFFSRPISASILGIALFVLISPLLWRKKLFGNVRVQE